MECCAPSGLMAVACRPGSTAYLDGAKGLPPITASRRRSLKVPMPVPAMFSCVAFRPRWLAATCPQRRYIVRGCNHRPIPFCLFAQRQRTQQDSLPQAPSANGLL